MSKSTHTHTHTHTHKRKKPQMHSRLPPPKSPYEWNLRDYRKTVKLHWRKLYPNSVGPDKRIVSTCWDLFLSVDACMKYIADYQPEAMEPPKKKNEGEK